MVRDPVGDSPTKGVGESPVDVAGLMRELRAQVACPVSDDAGTVALYSSDASNYRVVPLAVVMPRTIDDIIAAVSVAGSFGAPLVPRGGGTSMAGNAIGGVIIDTSRHLTEIADIDVDRRQAIVQPGVVLSDLKAATAEHGLTFAPDPSSANRCTIGGMIGNNACGARSVAWGTTADNVDRLDLLTYDGTRLDLGSVAPAELERLASAPGREAAKYAQVRDFVNQHELLIRRRFSDLRRRVSGYALDQLLPERGTHLARALVGGEGTCGTVLGATVRLVRLPAARVLLVLGFPTTFASAEAVPGILPHGPLTVEGINDELVARLPASARQGPGAAALPDGKAWLLIEVAGDTTDDARQRAQVIAGDVYAGDTSVTATIVTDASTQARLWRVRTDGAGLATRLPDGSEAWGGWEDAAVRPEQLGSYLRGFDALLDRFDYRGLAYGHFGEGCMHVRINFDLLSDHGIARFREFVEAATDLVIDHGGSVSGEHGDGRARSELLPRMYGDDVVAAFREFKSIWDPGDRMNPGVLVRAAGRDPADPEPLDDALRNAPNALPSRPLTIFSYPEDGGDFSQAARRCVGVGKCRRSSGGVMCPSFMVTNEETHSTRGRAHMLWEMLRGEVITDGWRSTQVRDALDLCLSCKGCKSDCPVNVDIATYKAEFLHHHYRNRVRPASHYSMGWLPWVARFASIAPTPVNAVMSASWTARLVKRLGGIAGERDMPRFAPRRAVRSFRGRGRAGRAGKPRVLLWPDTFTTYFQPEIGHAAIDVLEAAGFTVVLPRKPVCCGLTWISTGQLGIAQRVARQALEAVRAHVSQRVPIVGLEPSCTAVFRSDLTELMPEHDLASAVASNTFTLSEFLVEKAPGWLESIPALGADALVQTHCHQHSVMGFDADRRVLAAAGVIADVPDSGCCGLAGNFGFERGHYATSKAVGERVLLPAVRAADPNALIIADGFSCRTQIDQETSRQALHLAQVLQRAISRGPAQESP